MARGLGLSRLSGPPSPVPRPPSTPGVFSGEPGSAGSLATDPPVYGPPASPSPPRSGCRVHDGKVGPPVRVAFHSGDSIVHGGNDVHIRSVTLSGQPCTRRVVRPGSGGPGPRTPVGVRRSRTPVSALTVQNGKVGSSVRVIFSNWSSIVAGADTVPSPSVSNPRPPLLRPVARPPVAASPSRRAPSFVTSTRSTPVSPRPLLAARPPRPEPVPPSDPEVGYHRRGGPVRKDPCPGRRGSVAR